MKRKRLPIGQSDFRKLIAGDCYYADKTGFIRDVIDASAEVLLLPRPRRFGKTLNLSMLRFFFEKGIPDAKNLFKGMAIEADDCFDLHQGRYPVIFLTFKDVKEGSWDMCFMKLSNMIRKLYMENVTLKNLPDHADALFIRRILEAKAGRAEYEDSLKYLTEILHAAHGQPVLLLIDEYDTPLHAGYREGYYDEVIGFLRNFLSGGLKDNPHLFRGVLTGILRVAKESIFSGLNNLGVYTILDEKHSESFGFTEPDVKALLKAFDMTDRFEDVSQWYDGYRFGRSGIFNPWSLLNFIDGNGETKAYWTNTGDMSMIDRLATRGGKEIREEIGQLLEGKTIRRPVYETIVMRDLDLRDDLLWSFLLFSGYLTPVGDAEYRNRRSLVIPNEEVRLVYEELVIRWFSEKIESNCLLEMLQALSGGDMDLFERLLRKIVTQVMSYHDFSGEPEKAYHALVLGMLVWMAEKYEIRSNRESGYGRYDILLKPKSGKGTGIVIEFKLVEKSEKNAHEAVLAEALKQIRDRGYASELISAGFTDILEIAVAFRGKELWVGHRRSEGCPKPCRS